LIMPLAPVEIIDPTKDKNLVQLASFVIVRIIFMPSQRFLDSKPPEFAIPSNSKDIDFD
jgi:hypothetical protein